MDVLVSSPLLEGFRVPFRVAVEVYLRHFEDTFYLFLDVFAKGTNSVWIRYLSCFKHVSNSGNRRPDDKNSAFWVMFQQLSLDVDFGQIWGPFWASFWCPLAIIFQSFRDIVFRSSFRMPLFDLLRTNVAKWLALCVVPVAGPLSF